MAEYTVGEASAGLGNDGRFLLYRPAISSSELSREQAEALAALWPKQFGSWVARSLERGHGGPISVDSLRVCGTSYYAQSAFEPFTEELKARDPAHARVFGPWWLVTLCSGAGQPQVSLSVASYSTDLKIENGEIMMPKLGGEWFSWEGIPKAIGFDFVESPERLVQRTAEATGRRVAKVPELHVPLRVDGFPNHPRWRLALDKPISALANGRGSRQTSDVASWRRPGGSKHQYQVPLANQPDEITFRYPDPSSSKGPYAPLTFLEGAARRRPDAPVVYETVEVRGEAE